MHSPGPTSSGPGAPPPSPSQAAEKIYLVVLENQSYETVAGNPSMPFLNGLASSGAVADSFYAETHPSIGNYFHLTTGDTITNDDSFDGIVTQDNLAQELKAAGRSWRVYAEDLPSAGYLGGDVGGYVRHHDPFSYFATVQNDPQAAANIVPFTAFASDSSTGNTANFNLLVPNVSHDMHDCLLGTAACAAAADQWLNANLSPLLRSDDFKANGLLIITFDESALIDLQHGGGHVLTVLSGSQVKGGFHSNTFYNHDSLLRLVCAKLGCPALPGAAANAPAMDEFLR